jgi:hypothetical protein
MKMEIFNLYHIAITKDREIFRFISMGTKEVDLKIVSPFNQTYSRALTITKAYCLNSKREKAIG